METIVLGGGCFWCLEAVFRRIKGISKVYNGYSGGTLPNPTYEQVSSGTTGHAEVVKLEYNFNLIDLDTILDIFFAIHDPTTLNSQGHDVGTQYRSIILYETDKQKEIAENYLIKIQNNFRNAVVTELQLLDKFYTAEDYHQNYFEKNPFSGYCMAIVAPKVIKTYEKFDDLLKDEYKDQ